MLLCPFCENVYDESEYSHCPYCSGELEEIKDERYYKKCPNCNGIMYWDNCWLCSNCGEEIYSGIENNDGVIEG